MESKRNLHRYDIIEAEIIMKETSICDSWQ